MELPTIIIEYNPEAQGVSLQAKGFRNPCMIKAALLMAADEIDHQIRVQRAVAQQAQAQTNQLAQRVINGRH